MNFKFDENKAIAIFLYVAKKLHDEHVKTDLHKIFKIIYFADQKHMVKYGRPVLIGDDYIAMKNGPVPSKVYDITKIVRGGALPIRYEGKAYSEYFKMIGHYVTPLTEPDIEELSESDIRCLDESIYENKSLGFDELTVKSHDSAYNSACKDDRIFLRQVAKAAGATTEMLKYMHEKLEAENCFA